MTPGLTRKSDSIDTDGMPGGESLLKKFAEIFERWQFLSLNAERIGQLNVSPELLNALLERAKPAEASHARRQ